MPRLRVGKKDSFFIFSLDVIGHDFFRVIVVHFDSIIFFPSIDSRGESFFLELIGDMAVKGLVKLGKKKKVLRRTHCPLGTFNTANRMHLDIHHAIVLYKPPLRFQSCIYI